MGCKNRLFSSCQDANTIESQELIFLASDPTVSVCLSNSTTGLPFISTLELRQFNGSVYLTPVEDQYFLSVSARINFGADNEDPVRYPDDPFDRIWQSDLVKKANYLVDVAVGTEKVSTNLPIDIGKDEMPPQKVMQTAVVGRNGSLTYRLNLDGFPGFGWAYTYFAEIEDLNPTQTRKFRLVLPGAPDLSKAIVNIQENAQGNYRVYEPGFYNISLPFVLSFKFTKPPDSTEGPLVNAIEISKYIEISDGSFDGAVAASLVSGYKSLDWAEEGGDPCLPVPWSWVECNSDRQPKIISVKLSNKNISGSIPSELTKLSSLEELWLDGNAFTGSIPDFSGCPNLKIIFGDDSCLILWDARTGFSPVVKVEKAHHADLHCVDWNPFDENLLLTGGDGPLSVCNMRSNNVHTQSDFSEDEPLSVVVMKTVATFSSHVMAAIGGNTAGPDREKGG